MKSFRKKRGARAGVTIRSAYYIRQFFCHLSSCKDDSISLHYFTVHMLTLSVCKIRIQGWCYSSMCTVHCRWSAANHRVLQKVSH